MGSYESFIFDCHKVLQKVDKGNTLKKTGKYEDAVKYYTEAKAEAEGMKEKYIADGKKSKYIDSMITSLSGLIRQCTKESNKAKDNSKKVSI